RGAPSSRTGRGRTSGGGDRARAPGGPDAVRKYRRLLTYVRPYVWPHGVMAVLLSLCFSAVETSIPVVVSWVFDKGVVPPHPERLYLAVAAVLVMGVSRGMFSFGGNYLTDWVGQRVVTRLRNELTTHMQRLDLAFFNRQRAGQIVSRVTNDVTLVSNT